MDGFKKLHDDLEKVIEKEDTNSSVTTDSDESKNMPIPLHERVNHAIHTNKFQITIVCLVILDCLLVVSELLIDLQVIEAPDEHLEIAGKTLHFASIGILSLFLVELAVKLFAMRLTFFKHKMEMFDAVIVIVSFALDIAFIDNEDVEASVGLLVILRLWRVTRILNGIVLSVKAQADKKITREKRMREAVEQELAKFREYCTAQENEIEVLQGLLRKHGIAFQEMEKPVLPVRTIDVVAEVNEIIEKGEKLPGPAIEPAT